MSSAEDDATERAKTEINAALVKVGEVLAPLSDPSRGPGAAMMALARPRFDLPLWTPGDKLPNAQAVIARVWSVYARYYAIRGFCWLVELARRAPGA